MTVPVSVRMAVSVRMTVFTMRMSVPVRMTVLSMRMPVFPVRMAVFAVCGS
jgi:hypothetical protein